MTRSIAAALALVTAATLLLRTGIIHSGYWIDEAITVGIASHDLGDIPRTLLQDGSPPLFYLLLHGWMALAGTGEAATRALPLLFALLAVPVSWWAGNAVFDRRAGALAAAGAAGCPFLTYYAQETRMYSLVALLSVLACASFVLAFLHGRRRHVWLLGVWLVLLLYTHNWALFLAAGMAADVAVAVARGPGRRARRRAARRGRRAALRAVAAEPLFQASNTAAPWASRPSPLWLLGIPGGLFGYAASPLLAIAAVGALRRRRAAEGVRVLALIAAVAASLAFLGSQVEPAWAPRYLAVLFGPLLLALAAVLSRGHALDVGGARGRGRRLARVRPRAGEEQRAGGRRHRRARRSGRATSSSARSPSRCPCCTATCRRACASSRRSGPSRSRGDGLARRRGAAARGQRRARAGAARGAARARPPRAPGHARPRGGCRRRRGAGRCASARASGARGCAPTRACARSAARRARPGRPGAAACGRSCSRCARTVGRERPPDARPPRRVDLERRAPPAGSGRPAAVAARARAGRRAAPRSSTTSRSAGCPPTSPARSRPPSCSASPARPPTSAGARSTSATGRAARSTSSIPSTSPPGSAASARRRTPRRGRSSRRASAAAVDELRGDGRPRGDPRRLRARRDRAPHRRRPAHARTARQRQPDGDRARRARASARLRAARTGARDAGHRVACAAGMRRSLTLVLAVAAALSLAAPAQARAPTRCGRARRSAGTYPNRSWTFTVPSGNWATATTCAGSRPELTLLMLGNTATPAVQAATHDVHARPPAR